MLVAGFGKTKIALSLMFNLLKHAHFNVLTCCLKLFTVVGRVQRESSRCVALRSSATAVILLQFFPYSNPGDDGNLPGGEYLIFLLPNSFYTGLAKKVRLSHPSLFWRSSLLLLRVPLFSFHVLSSSFFFLHGFAHNPM